MSIGPGFGTSYRGRNYISAGVLVGPRKKYLRCPWKWCKNGKDMTPAFLQTRIDFYEGLIVELEAAIYGLSSGTISSYTLNTGQSTETVTKRTLGAISARLDWAYSRLDYFTMRRNGGVSVIVRPG